jgi:hypothetical protein
MHLSRYAKLLVESNLTHDSFGRKIKAAIETIFDVDDVNIQKTNFSKGPKFANSHFSAVLIFKYRNIPLEMTVHFYHLKFSKSELKHLTTNQFMDMVQSSESIPKIETPEDILRSPNIQVMLSAVLTYKPVTYTKDIIGIDDMEDVKDIHIGIVNSNNIRNLMIKAKQLIDKLGGDDNAPDEPEPVAPIPTNKKLVPV